MGIFELFKGFFKEDYPICNSCGAKMTEFDGVSWYTCPDCGDSVRENDDGTFTWEDEIFGTSKSGGGRVCINCDTSLNGGEYTSAWEDGDNEDAYVICPKCRYKNEIY